MKRAIAEFARLPKEVQAARHLSWAVLDGLNGLGIAPYHAWGIRWSNVTAALETTWARTDPRKGGPA